MEWLLIITILVALIDWLALRQGWKKVDYVAKPGVILLLMLWLLSGTSSGSNPPEFYFLLLALVFSLIGDLILLLPGDRLLGGLIAFLITHLAYILAFTRRPVDINIILFGLALVAVLAGGLLYRRIHQGLRRSGRKLMTLWAAIYAFLITLMVIAALSTWFRQAWPQNAALLVSTGAALFFISDSLLGWSRFVQDWPNRTLHIRIPYHLGQIAIVAGTSLAIL